MKQPEFQFRKPASHSKLHKVPTVDWHTIYDVPHKVETLARDIRAGKYGQVTDAVIVIQSPRQGGNVNHTYQFHFGRGGRATTMMMLQCYVRDLLK